MNQFTFWTMFGFAYIYLKNKFFLFWIYNDFKYEVCKAGFMGFAHFVATMVSYPWYMIREMVDLWPKERGGHCTWNNSYRECAKWMVNNMEWNYYNYFRGYVQWQKRYGVPYFIAIWMADSLGMYSNCNESYNSYETQFPIFSESV